MQFRKKLIAWISFILIITTKSLADEQDAIKMLEPLMPKLPTVPKSSDPKSNAEAVASTLKPEKKAERKIIACNGVITLGSKKTFSGKIYLPEYLEFDHLVDGILFSKKIHACEIQYFKVSGYRMTQSAATEFGQFYEFQPEVFKIIDSHENPFQVTRMKTELTSIDFESNLGKTKLYFIFADEYHPKKGWKTDASQDFEARRLKSHPQSISKISIQKKGAGKGGIAKP